MERDMQNLEQEADCVLPGLVKIGPSSFRVELTVTNELGLHARPAAKLAQTAQRYQSELICSHGERKADAKSILDILSLAANQGSVIQLEAAGPDACMAMQDLALLIRRQFREDS